MAQQWQSPRTQHRIPKSGRFALGCGALAAFILVTASCGTAVEQQNASPITRTVTVTASPAQPTVTVTVTAEPDPGKPRRPQAAKKPKPSKTSKPAVPKASKPPAPKTDPRFPTCGAANDAGYGPYHRGQDPEYSWYIDRDGDGIACER